MGSRPFEVADAFEANELFGRNGWTDGLPIVPPTLAMIRHPIAPDGDGALRQKAAEALHQCQELLLRR